MNGVGAATEFMPVTAAVIRRAGSILLASRPPGKHLAGRWEFPGGKPHPGESQAAALRRELREELGLDILVLDLLWRECHRYPDKAVDLRFYRCLLCVSDAVPTPREGQQVAWVEPARLTAVEWVPADLPFARWLANR
jgi:8-oxo-dGTP diphosphatase